MQFFLVLFTFNATNAQKRGPSTLEERQKAVQLVDLLERDPLSKDAKKYRGVLLNWIDDVPDITVRYCVEALGDVTKMKGDEGGILVAQQIFSATKFIIQNPDKANDDEAVNLAGLEGVLRTYEALKKARAKVRFSSIDKLLELRESGQLSHHIKTAMQSCPRE